MTTTKKTAGQTKAKATQDDGNFVLSAVRSGLGAMESGTLTVAEFPLTVLSGLGVPSEATDSAREGSRKMLHGVSGSIDTIATQTTKLAGKGVSLLTSAVGVKKS